ncbi:CAP domain-containing protein [Guptibacillus algicola]|uniref:CAP domain-containing protein n=1 Tax=Guptibacillus algicola TaxID=225844 RepID=UPI001CD7873A|nr:CAP domain-containing protein [Alkalihalobacillus algicola]MCA0987944.1 CAP domain-containing protein [Alkalihalobacillus algicola]
MIKNGIRIVLLIVIVVVTVDAYNKIDWDRVLPKVDRFITEEKFVLEETVPETGAEKDVNEEPIELTGVETWMGENASSLSDELGEPDRVDPSAYGYDWWIYEQSSSAYLQVGVQDEKVVTVFFMGDIKASGHYPIGEQEETVFQDRSPTDEVSLNAAGSVYRFQLTEEEKSLKPLVKISDDLYAQYYFDKFNGKLAAVRLANPEVLATQRPYAVSYRGELLETESLSDEQWEDVQLAREKQVFAMTNVIRNQFEKEPLGYNDAVSEVAVRHSKDMHDNEYFSHTSPTKGELSDRLKEGDVLYSYAGENIAARYPDAGAAMIGWLNSKGHREALLNKDFTEIGVGVFREYYTQNFIKPF